MRRLLLVAMCLGWATLAAGAACSSFSSTEAPASGDDAGDEPETGTSTDGSVEDVVVSDVVPMPDARAGCVPEPPAAPCNTACVQTLIPLPPSTSSPGNVTNARIAVHGDTIYVTRTVDGARVELFSLVATTTTWKLRGSFPAADAFGLAANDTTILVSLQETTPDGAPANQQVVEVGIDCDASCTESMVPVQGSTAAGPGAVAVGPNFYFSGAANVVALPVGGTIPSNVASLFGAPVVAADCTYVYYSNAFSSSVYRYDPATHGSQPLGTGVGDFDAGALYPGTLGLAASNDEVFATTGSGRVYGMPKDPTHQAHVIVADAGVGGAIVADSRYVYYAEPRGAFTYAIVRVQPDGGGRQSVSAPLTKLVGMAMDADHVYAITANAIVTVIAK